MFDLIELSKQNPEQLQKVVDQVRAVEKGEAKFPVAAVPEHTNLKSLETYLPERTRYRGTFTTSLIDKLAEYINHEHIGLQRAACFVDKDSLVATAFIDLFSDNGKQGHCQHAAVCELQKVAVYKAILRADGQRFSQRDLAEWVEDWANYLTVINSDGGVISMVDAVQAIRNIDFEQVRRSSSSDGNFQASLSEFELMELKNADKFPAYIEVTCIPYLGLSTRTFRLRVAAISEDRNKELSLRIAALEEHQEQIAIDFAERIQTAIAGLPVFVGGFDPK